MWKQEKKDNVFVLVPQGRLDSTSSKAFEEHALRLVAEGETRMLIDMAGVDYVSSAGLRALLTINRKITSDNGKLVLSGMTAPVKEVFELASFTALFSIAADQQEGLASLKG